MSQIENLKKNIVKGIGYHNADLMPIVKEIVEILFEQGLIKVLLATSTFSMGINMPAKSVVFTSLRKYNGRWMPLNSCDYT